MSKPEVPLKATPEEWSDLADQVAQDRIGPARSRHWSVRSVPLVILALVAFLALSALVGLGRARSAETISNAYARGPTVSNQTSVVLVIREFSFGDGPETTSDLVEIAPGADHIVQCGSMREYSLETTDGRVLPVHVSCISEASVVVKESDLEGAA